MSLVHEALEKAKREASAKSSRDLGLPEPTGQPFRARRARHPLFYGGVAALSLAVLTGAAYWVLRPMVARSAEMTAAESAAAAVSAPTAPAPPAPAAPTPPAAGPPETPVAAPTVAAAPAGAAPQSVAAPVDPPAAARPAPPAPAQAPSFRRRATLADGTVVELGGIAWSEEAPLAYLNGRLYVKGERVGGMRVERIERERVLLVGADGERLYLSLH